MKTLARIGRARALVRYFRDPAASVLGKVFVFATVLYVISPVDLIPDAIPIVGWLDDVGLMSLAVAWMWKVVARYRDASAVTPSPTRGDRALSAAPALV